ncbi:Uncharacterised protein [Vibrio cholerae]|nr:Uncharacterised protein [Vibrio cholerae]CSI29262.1 Uncharacterised protein [Vibrio cholerae]
MKSIADEFIRNRGIANGMPTSFLLIEGYFPCKKSVICGKSGLKIVTL